MEKNHRHNFEEVEGRLICSCGKEKLALNPIQSNPDILQAKRVNGINYTVRKDRHRYFFPDEWEAFISQITNSKHKLLFKTLLHTGSRIMEALHLKAEDFDFDRSTVTLKVVKQRKAKKRYYASGKTRSFFVSPKYLRQVKKYIKQNNLAPGDFLFMDNDKLPENYDSFSNKQKREYYHKKFVSYSAMLKRKLKAAKIKDPWNFSLHNIRKTYGNWMRTFEIELAELCYRMGHDMDTFLAHYGSSLIFTPEERRKILKIMGEVK